MRASKRGTLTPDTVLTTDSISVATPLEKGMVRSESMQNPARPLKRVSLTGIFWSTENTNALSPARYL